MPIFYEEKMEECIQMLKYSAARCFSKAQLMLGLHYHFGEGIDKDCNKVVYYFNLATKEDIEALNNIY